MAYLISRWTVWRRRNGLNFLISSFSVFVFLFRVVVYREGGLPSLRASVHSIVMISRGMLFLFFGGRFFLSFLFFAFHFNAGRAVDRAEVAQPALA